MTTPPKLASSPTPGAPPANACGECTLCCKLRGVGELRKMPYEWCPHCAIGSGCTVYGMRPRSCAEYKCLWLETQDSKTEPPLWPETRPDRSKVIIERDKANDIFVFFVDPGRRDAWRAQPMNSFIEGLMTLGSHVLVLTEGNRQLAGNVRAQAMSPEEEMRLFDAEP